MQAITACRVDPRVFLSVRAITMTEVAALTGINRMTLSKIANHPGYSTVTDNLDKLCEYFGCRLEQLAEHIPITAASIDDGATGPKDQA